ncbi:MAG TPA: ABC transporter permease [Thermoanaerobaculia bacterium]|nr:ABC transporter permease [Thermoanaerobaculia bacterium]
MRQILRQLARTPGFTLLCVFTLAVGVGSDTAVFSVLQGILLRPLPFPQAERLVGVWHTAPGLGLAEMPQSPATYQLYRQRGGTFAGIALYRQSTIELGEGDATAYLPAAEVTPSLFPVLGVAPELGRAFAEEEGRPGAAPVVMVSDHIWRERLGADRGILGRTLRVDGVAAQVVGVMRPDFDFPVPETEAWRPLPIAAATSDLYRFQFLGVARLAPGVSAAAAEADLKRLDAGLPQAFPGSPDAAGLLRGGFTAFLRPLRRDLIGEIGRVLWILLGSVSCILLIACANVANLLIVRGEGRRRRTAIQTALGASRRRLVGAVLGESLVVGFASGAAGTLLAWAGIRLLVHLRPAEVPRLQEVRIDGRVLAFTALVALAASLLAGLIPALRSTAVSDLAGELRGAAWAVKSGRLRPRARQVLVALQVAIAVVLLTGSGLLLRSLQRVARLHPGFEAANVLSLRLNLPESTYPDDEAAARFYRTLEDRLTAHPEVAAAGVSQLLPLTGTQAPAGHEVEDHPRPPGSPPPVFSVTLASDGYFRAMRIPLLEGRALERQDAERRSGAVVISQGLAHRFWPRGGALGKLLRPVIEEGVTAGAPGPWYEVVGVAGDVRGRNLTEPPRDLVYYPLLAKAKGEYFARQLFVVLRSRIEPARLAPIVRREIAGLDPSLHIANLQTMEQYMLRSRARLTFAALMVLIAAAVALALGAIGVYGFVSYLVSQRTPEIGVRVALGAGAADVRRMVLRDALAVAAAGLAAGMMGAAALTRTLGSLLFEVRPLDPLTFALVPGLLAALVLLSSFLPAERAARIDPVKALQPLE